MAAVRRKERGDTAANWVATNPILAENEIGREEDTNKFKFGDGATAWNGLGYAGGGDHADSEHAGLATKEYSRYEAIGIAVSDETTALTAGANKVSFRMPFGMTLTEVRSNVVVASTSGLVTVDINKGVTTILSTKLSIDATERTSKTAATPPVISNFNLVSDEEIVVDIDAAGTGAKGLKIWLIGTRTDP